MDGSPVDAQLLRDMVDGALADGANPGKISYASYSAVTLSHVLGAQMNKAVGLALIHLAVLTTPMRWSS